MWKTYAGFPVETPQVGVQKTVKTIATVAIGWVVAFIVSLIIGMIFGIGMIGAGVLGNMFSG